MSSWDRSSKIKSICQNALIIPRIKYPKYCYIFFLYGPNPVAIFIMKKKCIYLNGNIVITAFSWGNREKNAERQILVMYMDVNLMVIHFPMFSLSYSFFFDF